MNAGVYQILNLVNGQRYIGSAADFSKRWSAHRKLLRNTAHSNQKLQRAWSKYGEAAFVFKPLLLCAPKNLLMYEQQCLDGYKPTYNICKIAGSPLGLKHTAETKAKMSAAHTGRIFSAEHRANISAARKGINFSASHRANLSKARVGRIIPPFTKEHREKLAVAARKWRAR